MNKELRDKLQGIIEEGGFVLELETESSVAFCRKIHDTDFCIRINLLEEDVILSNFVDKKEAGNSEFGRALMLASMEYNDEAYKILKPLADVVTAQGEQNRLEITDENIDICNDVISSALGNIPLYINNLDVDEDRKSMLKRMCKMFIANTVIPQSDITLDEINKYWGLSCD